MGRGSRRQFDGSRALPRPGGCNKWLAAAPTYIPTCRRGGAGGCRRPRDRGAGGTGPVRRCARRGRTAGSALRASGWSGGGVGRDQEGAAGAGPVGREGPVAHGANARLSRRSNGDAARQSRGSREEERRGRARVTLATATATATTVITVTTTTTTGTGRWSLLVHLRQAFLAGRVHGLLLGPAPSTNEEGAREVRGVGRRPPFADSSKLF
jgi:hypothetical protein